MKRLIVLLILTTSCTSYTKTTPTEPSQKVTTISYDINVLDYLSFQNDIQTYGQTIALNPITAEQLFSEEQYTYWGTTSPPDGHLTNASIVIAPRSVASEDCFNGSEWSVFNYEPITKYCWIGRFTFVREE